MPQLPNTKLLQAFEATARLGSITSASQELFIAPSALSRQIKTLENQLNFDLFSRGNNRLALTDQGRIFYEVLSKNFREIASCTASIQKGLQRIVIKAPPSFATCWLAPRLPQFYAENKCLITLQIDGSHYDLMTHHCDVEILFGHSASISTTRSILFEERIFPACSPSLLETINKQGVDSVPIIHTLSGVVPLPYWDYWITQNPESKLAPRQSSIIAGMEFSSQVQAINAAIEGLGVLMVDVNIASRVLRSKKLIPLANPVATPFCYSLLENPQDMNKKDLIRRFNLWIKAESLVCPVNFKMA